LKQLPVVITALHPTVTELSSAAICYALSQFLMLSMNRSNLIPIHDEKNSIVRKKKKMAIGVFTRMTILTTLIKRTKKFKDLQT